VDGRAVGAGDDRSPSARWLYHSGLAYILLHPEPLTVHAGEATGSWRSINLSLPDTPVTERLFMPVINTPSASSGYVLAAAATSREATALAKKPAWEILRNDSLCQAVRFSDGVVMCAFWRAGAVDPGGHRQLSPDAHKKIAVDAPCLILLSGNKLYVSDPARSEKEITVSLDGKSRHLRLPGDGTTVREIF